MDVVERRGFRDFLGTLSSEVLRTLVDVITKKRISCTTKEESIEAIIVWSSSSRELFSRKCLVRDCLFDYMSSKNPGGFNVSASKAELQEIIQDYWRKVYSKQNHDQSTNALAVPGPSSGRSTLPFAASNSQNTINITHNYVVNKHVSIAPNVTVSLNSSDTEKQKQKLGEEFCKWFFEQLNSKHPQIGRSDSDFGPQHFLDDAYLLFLCLGPQKLEDFCSGSGPVTSKLLHFVQNESLLFNPNVSNEGVRVMCDPHGLIKVLVCGTIHKENQCLGIFDQMFGLIKDPRYDQNYKIKMTKLKMQVSNVLSMPKLTDKSPEEIEQLESV